MTILTTIHADRGLEIVMEFPDNQNGLRLRAKKGDWDKEEKADFMLYTSLDQWHELRKLIPKAEGYYLAIPGNEPSIRDHAEADAHAEEFYAAEMAKLIPAMPPEASGTDDIVDPDYFPQPQHPAPAQPEEANDGTDRNANDVF